MTILMIAVLVLVAVASIVAAVSTEGPLQGGFSFVGYLSVLGAMLVASM